jgi:hypothetical protein
MQVNLRNLQINPLSVTSSILFIIAPFLSWVTVSAFGLTADATLFDLAGGRAPLSVPSNLPQASLIAAILIIVGGLIILKTVKVGLPVAAAGLAMFLFTSYGLYGSSVSVIPVVIAPGIGLLTGTASVGVGAASFGIHCQDFKSYLRKIRTREGITGAGLFIATFAIALDGLNHAGLRELSSFVGSGMIEPLFHLGFFVSIFLLALLFSVRRRFLSVPINSFLIGAAFTLIVMDAVYHISTGDVTGFVGHDPTEIILHASAYYGAAFLLVGRLLKL